ncbi:MULTISPECIES: purple acid phosphatase family protein [Aliiglaciecola]|uniref:purple acid phosphatase family protein n=1 Tax=Aliiglaciecola TaxID=1406885 RepID=UPI001C0A0E1D|nr:MULTISPECIES: tartrate-resistant acid phosphatase type 5 family protein [Aliiglaciecola]MBU2876735.1 metallophosphoesterase [Aliiglaciecola lipolytica]MDO6710364.1 tartrate-resistant acid phosphatase type 5 family protein [Aliiglaciecola sp. 2_MG-2023]MDO6751511.1 tartrate-resistant acid phosphatase type 5 family protein [Aliiglaciecola sp. 1_MG-2023]
MFIRYVILVVLSVTSIAAFSKQVHDQNFYKKHHVQALATPKDSFSFLVLGDWGRNGHYQQQPVADMMDVVMQQIDGEFIATTGDNFYSNGVASVDDPYWQTSFEQIYHGPNLFEDWYPTLGNHDYRGNWQAQIDYSKRSRRWEFPSAYYAKTFKVGKNTEMLVLFIDTNPLNPEYKNRAKYAETQKPDGAKQLRWIEQQLANSTAKWNIVIGHHPLYSSGKRFGKTEGIQQVLEPIFEKYKVDAYFAGHEHDLQHNRPAGKLVEHFVSGAGSELRPVQQRVFTQYAKSEAGFLTVSVGDSNMLIQFISAAGERLYHYSMDKE